MESLALISLSISLISLLGGLSPIIDIFSHFRWQYACLLFLFTALLTAMRCVKTAIAVGMGLVINVACIGFLWIPVRQPHSGEVTPTLSILNINLNYGNKNYVLIESEIRTNNPDVIALEELTPEMLAHLKSILQDYPYECSLPRLDAYGIGLFSKHKFVHMDLNPLELPVSLVIRGDIEFDSRVVSIMVVHACGPTSVTGCMLDKHIADNLAKWIKTSKRRSVILIGDMNSTPWSIVFQRLLSSCRFIDSERGFPLQCSWPVGLPLISIPIDHCFFSSDWACVTRRLTGPVGSDHYPLFVRLTKESS